MQLLRVAILFLAGCLVAVPVIAQTGHLAFTRLGSEGPAPSPRLDAPIAYDAPGRQLILFGGLDGSGNRNDLWAYSLDRKQWKELNPTGDRPAPRHGHSLVFDPVRRRVICSAARPAGSSPTPGPMTSRGTPGGSSVPAAPPSGTPTPPSTTRGATA
jgi:hypothetical protein